MHWWQSIILGIVEGLTEYLPVSSTGHLILTQRLLGIPGGEAADAFAICIQAGAILAVLGLYADRVRRMLRGLIGRDADGLRLAINILSGFIPAAVIGLLVEKFIKEYLFGSGRWGLWPTVAAWFVGGAAILLIVWRRKARGQTSASGYPLADLTWRMAAIIGIAQCLAMWPGVSRSLVTIVGGVLVGLTLPAAVEFSFLLGVVTLGAATCYDGLKHGQAMIDQYGILTLVLGFAFAWLAAVLAVRWMVAYLNRHGLAIFGYYRVALALLVAALIWAGTLAVAPGPHGDVIPAPASQLPHAD